MSEPKAMLARLHQQIVTQPDRFARGASTVTGAMPAFGHAIDYIHHSLSIRSHQSESDST